MGHKNKATPVINWQSASPITNFIPNFGQYNGGSVPSGTLLGAMASTNTIYSNILDVSLMDNIGIEFNFNIGSGTAAGTISVMGSNSGANFYALTFSPVLTQPTSGAGGYLIDLNMYPFKYLMFQYVNASGSGNLSMYLQVRDLN